MASAVDAIGGALKALYSTSVLGVECEFLLAVDENIQNIATGEYDVDNDVTFDTTCTLPTDYNNGQIDGTRIQEDDFKTTINGASWTSGNAAFGVRPSIEMRIKIKQYSYKFDDGDYREFQIINVKPFITGESVAAWELQLRA